MKPFILPLILLHLFGLTASVSAQSASLPPTQVGPQNGSLVIVGGGGAGPDIIDTFIELAGGRDAPIVFITTANPGLTQEEREAKTALLKNRGAVDVTALHTMDPEEANTESFVAPLRNARGVWFGGGRQWHIVDSYENTLVEKLLWQVLERGGVIGGSSAGATIQGSYLARGDTRNNQIMTGDHEKGFGYLKNVAIDQHHLARNRHFDMFSILEKYPDLLGLGIDEGTALIVKGDVFEVIGRSYVTVYDGTFWSSEGIGRKEVPDKSSRFYFLKPGDRYDLAERRVITSNR